MFTFLPFFRKPVAASAEITARRWAIATLTREEKNVRDTFVARVDRTSFATKR